MLIIISVKRKMHHGHIKLLASKEEVDSKSLDLASKDDVCVTHGSRLTLIIS